MNASLLVLHSHWLTAEAVRDYVKADIVVPTTTSAVDPGRDHPPLTRF
jgi:hypothetical protein